MEENAGSKSESLNKFRKYSSNNDEQITSSQPIADLFPACTGELIPKLLVIVFVLLELIILFLNALVLFADISGFTAWSSTRDPSQVFTLLQSIYQAFDKIAKRRKVFKVEVRY